MHHSHSLTAAPAVAAAPNEFDAHNTNHLRLALSLPSAFPFAARLHPPGRLAAASRLATGGHDYGDLYPLQLTVFPDAHAPRVVGDLWAGGTRAALELAIDGFGQPSWRSAGGGLLIQFHATHLSASLGLPELRGGWDRGLNRAWQVFHLLAAEPCA
jgi:hypothetical protein